MANPLVQRAAKLIASMIRRRAGELSVEANDTASDHGFQEAERMQALATEIEETTWEVELAEPPALELDLEGGRIAYRDPDTNQAAYLELEDAKRVLIRHLEDFVWISVEDRAGQVVQGAVGPPDEDGTAYWYMEAGVQGD